MYCPYCGEKTVSVEVEWWEIVSPHDSSVSDIPENQCRECGGSFFADVPGEE